MQIICPDCHFSREVDENKVPAKSQVATCPKCKTKFKFRELPEEDAPQAEAVQTAPAPEAEPTPEADPVSPPQPAQATLPMQEEPERIFPKIDVPGEDHKEELWDKLGDMTPPEDLNSDAPEAKAESETEDQPSSPVSEQQPIPGWTGDFNGDFPDPMQAEIHEEDQEEAPMLVPPPFEQLDRYGFFYGIYMTIKLVLTSPRLFFSVMPVGGGLTKPLTFIILVAMIQALAQLVWGGAGLTPSIEISGNEIVAGAADLSKGMLELLLTPAAISFTLFLFAGFYHLLLILLKADNRGFEGSFRAVAYAYTPIITGIFPMPSISIIFVWMVIYMIWVLFLTAIGLKYIHGTTYTKIIPIVLMPLLLGMIAALTLAQAQLATI